MDHSRVEFNCSHDGGAVVAVFSEDTTAVGIDLVTVKLRNERRSQEDFFKIMNRIFDAHEWNLINGSLASELDNITVTLRAPDRMTSSTFRDSINSSSPAQSQLARFLLLWATKEAYMKLLGRGLTLDPADIHISVASHALRIRETTDMTETLHTTVTILEDDPVKIVCICYCGQLQHENWTLFPDLADLVEECNCPKNVA